MAWIEKRGKKYRVVWDTGTPENRKRKMQSFDSLPEAKQFKAKIELEISTGTYIEPAKLTFGQYLDHWLSIHGDKLAPKTLRSYRSEIENHIKPELGDIPLSKLSPMHLQEYYAKMLREGKVACNPEEKKGLSPTSVRYHHRIIHKALSQAVKWQMVARNVAEVVEPPQQEKKEIEYFPYNQVTEFLNVIKESPDYPIIATALLTGMRQGEILGLRWQDIDFEKGIIHVRQQLQYTPEKGYFFREPKRHSKRDLPLPLPLQAIFRKVKKEQMKLKGIYGEEYQDFDLVFCRPDGSPMDGTGITKRFQKLCQKHGFPKIRFHALRHSFATMCRAAGVSIEDLQDMLGHADISTTKKLYTHVEIEPLQKAMKKLTDFLDI